MINNEKNKEEKLTIDQQRRLSRLERELMSAVFKVSKSEKIDLIPVSYCTIDKKFQLLKAFVTFEENEESLKLISKINKKIAPLIRYNLAKTKLFSKIPKISFFVDKYFNYINEAEKILKEN